jgi:hypothetical protein
LPVYAAAVPWLWACLFAYRRFERRVEPLLLADSEPIVANPGELSIR